jgi:SAM-dependent methyltransferase
MTISQVSCHQTIETESASGEIPVLVCPVCNANSQFESGFSDIRLYRCAACEHCFTDAGRIARPEVYGPEYYSVVHRNWFNNPHTALFQRMREAIVAHKPTASVLDVGCGNGDLLKYLRAKEPDLSLTGIDLCPNSPVARIEFVRDNFLTYQFPGTFDVVTSLETIEHIADVQHFTRRLLELCNPGGLVIVNTINEQSVLYEVARRLKQAGFAAPFERLYSKHHLNHFNISSLRHLLEASGLTVVKLLRHNVPLAAVDLEASSGLPTTILRTGVWGTFAMGKITGKTYLQTVFCKRR